MITRKKTISVLTLVAPFWMSGVASAALIIDFSQVGPNAVVTGTTDADGFSIAGADAITPNNPGPANIMHLVTAYNLNRIRPGLSDRHTFNTGNHSAALWFGTSIPNTDATSSSPDSFGIAFSNFTDELAVYVPPGFSSGSISGSITFAGLDVANFGVITQSFTFGAGGADQTIIIGLNGSASPSAIPEPSTAVLLTLGMLGLVARRKRR